MSTEISVIEITPNSLTATTVGTQGVAGPSSIAGKDIAQTTVSTNGSILAYNSSSNKWETTVVPVGLTITGGSF